MSTQEADSLRRHSAEISARCPLAEPAKDVPTWVIFHLPHDSTLIPAEVRAQFLLTDEELQLELCRMTDHLTHALFCADAHAGTVVRARVSRLVVDVERFADDAREPMAARGMGAIYGKTSSLAPLRRQLTEEECSSLMREWYHPHHLALEKAVCSALERHDRCLVLDCHSFPAEPLPYEQRDPASIRPDICIGTDDFHTSEATARAFVSAFSRQGWSVALNQPFQGALVPASRYRRDARVSAVMVEINRGLYLHEGDATPRACFEEVGARIRASCAEAIASVLRGKA
jgi:N-formylglutamate amidohydrolase